MELSAILEFADRRPFHPFTIEMEGGQRATVRHAEDIMFSPNRIKLRDVIVYDSEHDRRFFIAPSAVTAISEIPEEVY
ncbi:MAG TPA: hypothetical protein VF950_20805 [Planctomycetota bacterium]